MNWREGTETMTVNEIVKWYVHEGEVWLSMESRGNEAYGVVMNREQAVNMICGLAALVAQMEDK